ncbi:hypothetical protein [Qipengyuania nanhaisediminis]|nr:hypothetical protein [Qipengyuania nanhaisediminis]
MKERNYLREIALLLGACVLLAALLFILVFSPCLFGFGACP